MHVVFIRFGFALIFDRRWSQHASASFAGIGKKLSMGKVCYRGISCKIMFPLKYNTSFSSRQVYNSVVGNRAIRLVNLAV